MKMPVILDPMRLLKAFQFAGQGFFWLMKNERAFQQEFIGVVILLPTLCLHPFSRVENLLMVMSLLIVLITEALNTGIERALDRVSREIHPLTGIAKDSASLAVTTSLILAAVVWLTLWWPVWFPA